MIAPARTLEIITPDSQKIANQRLESLGFKVSFGQHVNESDDFASSSIESRLEDFHEAFADPNVKGILTVIGGFNSNQLLRQVNWDLIRDNPKVFCGFSDITALNNSMLAKSGLVSYSGPHYSTFGMKNEFDYIMESFKACLMMDKPIDLKPSANSSDDNWWIDQDNRKLIKNDGWMVINSGEAEGTLIGGNLCTLNLLQGSEFMPNLENTILFLEDDEESKPHHFDRNLVSLIQQPGFENVKGMVLGRFQEASKFSNDLIKQMISSKKELGSIPVIANIDIGHTSPMITFPVGGVVQIVADAHSPKITITKH